VLLAPGSFVIEQVHLFPYWFGESIFSVNHGCVNATLHGGETSDEEEGVVLVRSCRILLFDALFKQLSNLPTAALK
jgi:hypothetical protein